MKNFVISLKNAKIRREHIISEFGKNNVKFEFFDALEPSKELDELIRNELPGLQYSSLTNTEKACFMSHFILIKQCIEKEIEYFSIFEDDIVLSRDSHSFLSNSKWITSLNFNSHYILKLEAFPIRVSAKKKTRTLNARKIVQIMSPNLGTAGYILHIDSGKYLISLLKKLTDVAPLDEIIFNRYIVEKKIDIFQISPTLCIQEQFYNIGTSALKSQLDEERTANINKVSENRNIRIIPKIYREISRLFDMKSKIRFR